MLALSVASLGLTWAQAGLVVVTALAIYAVTMAASRLFGQRQFATLSSYDLVFVFALGSIIGRVILVRTSLAAAVLGLGTLFSAHAVVGWLHHRVPTVHRVLQNRPILLVARGRLLPSQLRRAHMSRLELFQYLREQGHASLDDLEAVVLEPSGELSVLATGTPIDDAFLRDVDGIERLDRTSA